MTKPHFSLKVYSHILQKVYECINTIILNYRFDSLDNIADSIEPKIILYNLLKDMKSLTRDPDAIEEIDEFMKEVEDYLQQDHSLLMTFESRSRGFTQVTNGDADL